jgi:hypothetical protein
VFQGGNDFRVASFSLALIGFSICTFPDFHETCPNRLDYPVGGLLFAEPAQNRQQEVAGKVTPSGG